MSDPKYPAGVTNRDIDRTCGETINPDMCDHKYVVCENCGCTMKELDKAESKIKKVQDRLKNIKILCSYMNGFHPPICNGWGTYQHKIVFENSDCDCIVSDIIHEIEMAEDFI